MKKTRQGAGLVVMVFVGATVALFGWLTVRQGGWLLVVALFPTFLLAWIVTRESAIVGKGSPKTGTVTAVGIVEILLGIETLLGWELLLGLNLIH